MKVSQILYMGRLQEIFIVGVFFMASAREGILCASGSEREQLGSWAEVTVSSQSNGFLFIDGEAEAQVGNADQFFVQSHN